MFQFKMFSISLDTGKKTLRECNDRGGLSQDPPLKCDFFFLYEFSFRYYFDNWLHRRDCNAYTS